MCSDCLLRAGIFDIVSSDDEYLFHHFGSCNRSVSGEVDLLRRLLLVLLSDQPYEPDVEYQLAIGDGSDEATHIARFPVDAVVEQWKRSSEDLSTFDPTDDKPLFDRILVVTTPEVIEKFPELQPGLRELLLSWTNVEEIELLEVSQAEAEPMDLHRNLNDKLGDEPINVVADLSGLSKDFAIIIPSILRQRSVEGKGVARVYCSSKISGQGEQLRFKVVDLNPLERLASFHSAVGQLLDTGHSRNLIQQLRDVQKDVIANYEEWIDSIPDDQKRVQGRNNPHRSGQYYITHFIEILEQYSEQFVAGMVMGSLSWSEHSDKINQGSEFLKNRAPEWSKALDHLCEQIQETIQESPTADQHLDPREFNRHIQIARKLLEYRSFGPALQILRECATSRVLIEREGFGSPAGLNKTLRENCGKLLTRAIKENRNSNVDTNLSFLGQLGTDRNTFSHAAFKKDSDPASMLVNKWLPENEAFPTIKKLLVNNDSFWREHFFRREVTGHWLVTPLGMSPGTLFTFLEHYLPAVENSADGSTRKPPEGLVILTSAAGAERVPEILSKVNWKQRIPDLQLHVVQFGDDDEDIWTAPLKCDVRQVQTVDGLCVADVLADASRITCNLTGGTSSLCIFADRLVSEMSSPDVDVRWRICVDRRSHQEQQAAPFVRGEGRRIK